VRNRAPTFSWATYPAHRSFTKEYSSRCEVRLRPDRKNARPAEGAAFAQAETSVPLLNLEMNNLQPNG
jgi:hypothetical protein